MNIFTKKYYKQADRNNAQPMKKPDFFIEKNNKLTTTKLEPLGNNKYQGILHSKGSVNPPSAIHRVLTKMGFGATPESIAHVQSFSGSTEEDKIHAYIDEQLDPDSISDSAVDALLTHGYQTLNKTRTQLFQEHYRRPDGMEIEWYFHILPGRETYYASCVRGTQSNKQLLEVMADFWHNHFNVYLDGDGIPPMFVHYDRDVIRSNALGSFRQMLEDVTKATCMLDYLGNGYNHKDAPNENYAREILELHTISAKNYFGHMPWQDVPTDSEGRRMGYVEEDVLEMARALTGWSYSGADYEANATGEFLFRDTWHDEGTKRVMGDNYSFNAGQPLKDVTDILDMLAEHPATAEFLAVKLCTRFISDTPSQAIIDQVKDVLHQNWQAADQIKLAMEVLLKSSEFLNTWGDKVKRPYERAISAMRQLGYTYDFDPTNEHSDYHFWTFLNTGGMPFYWTSPDGYPDVKESWFGSSSTMSTWRYVQWTGQFRDSGDVPYNDVLNQTLAEFPNPADRTANNIVNYWFERACGIPPDANDQDKLANFMSFDDTTNPQGTDRDTPIDLTSAAANEWPSYNQERLYAVVSTILLTPEFNQR